MYPLTRLVAWRVAADAWRARIEVWMAYEEALHVCISDGSAADAAHADAALRAVDDAACAAIDAWRVYGDAWGALYREDKEVQV